MPIIETTGPYMPDAPPIRIYTVRCDACANYLADRDAQQPRQFMTEPAAAQSAKDHLWFHFKNTLICAVCLKAHTPKPQPLWHRTPPSNRNPNFPG